MPRAPGAAERWGGDLSIQKYPSSGLSSESKRGGLCLHGKLTDSMCARSHGARDASTMLLRCFYDAST